MDVSYPITSCIQKYFDFTVILTLLGLHVFMVPNINKIQVFELYFILNKTKVPHKNMNELLLGV